MGRIYEECESEIQWRIYQECVRTHYGGYEKRRVSLTREICRGNDMGEKITNAEIPVLGWPLKLGAGMFVFSILLPFAGVPLVTALDLSKSLTTSLSGAFLIGGELFGLMAVAVMGKSGYAYIKNQVFGFLKKYGPPGKVSRLRYTIGLIMLSIPILFGWLSPYCADLIPGFVSAPVYWAVSGDLLFLMSLFVLGGEFWDKIRSLFVHNSEARFQV